MPPMEIMLESKIEKKWFIDEWELNLYEITTHLEFNKNFIYLSFEETRSLLNLPFVLFIVLEDIHCTEDLSEVYRYLKTIIQCLRRLCIKYRLIIVYKSSVIYIIAVLLEK